jgi:hypothetical protein
MLNWSWHLILLLFWSRVSDCLIVIAGLNVFIVENLSLIFVKIFNYPLSLV